MCTSASLLYRKINSIQTFTGEQSDGFYKISASFAERQIF